MAPRARSEPLTPIPLAHQQLRQAAHADAADADEVVGGFIVQFHYVILNSHIE